MDPNGVDAWLLASERDRTPGHLLGGLSTSLVGDPGAAISVEDLRDLVLLRAPDSVCIVIDDAHVLDGSEAWELVERLLDALPRNGHLAIGSRTMPPLSVRRRQAEGEARVIEQTELAFTAEELDDLVTKLGIDPAQGRRLPSWPALAVLSGSAGVDASLGYLWEEILAALPDERRRALALVAHLELIDDELVQAVAGTEWTASALLAGLPLVDSVGASHRLHDLWRAALADVVEPEHLAARDRERRRGAARPRGSGAGREGPARRRRHRPRRRGDPAVRVVADQRRAEPGRCGGALRPAPFNRPSRTGRAVPDVDPAVELRPGREGAPRHARRVRRGRRRRDACPRVVATRAARGRAGSHVRDRSRRAAGPCCGGLAVRSVGGGVDPLPRRPGGGRRGDRDRGARRPRRSPPPGPTGGVGRPAPGPRSPGAGGHHPG